MTLEQVQEKVEFQNFPSFLVNLILFNSTLNCPNIELKKLEIMYIYCVNNTVMVKYFLTQSYWPSAQQYIWFHFLFFPPSLLVDNTYRNLCFSLQARLLLMTCMLYFRCCLYNNHQAKDCIDSFVTHCVRVRTTVWVAGMDTSKIVGYDSFGSISLCCFFLSYFLFIFTE